MTLIKQDSIDESGKDDIPKTKENEMEDELQSFLSYFRQSKLSPPEEWPDESPVLVTASVRAPHVQYDLSLGGSLQAFPLDGQVVHFKGPLFEGRIVSRMRDVPPCTAEFLSFPPAKVNSQMYFKGRSRQFQWSVQGQFSKRTRFDQVITGQDFDRPFRNAPAVGLVKRGLELLKPKLPETFECDLFTESPRFEHPLIAGCQFFRVDDPKALADADKSALLGESENGEIVEDSRLLGDSSVPRDAAARRKFFSKKENLERFYFEPDLVYTFEFYANFFSPARHSLELTSFFNVDLIPYFNGYPLFMALAKDKNSGEYMWGTEMWHKRLLEFDVKPGIVSRLFTSSRKLLFKRSSSLSESF